MSTWVLLRIHVVRTCTCIHCLLYVDRFPITYAPWHASVVWCLSASFPSYIHLVYVVVVVQCMFTGFLLHVLHAVVDPSMFTCALLHIHPMCASVVRYTSTYVPLDVI